MTALVRYQAALLVRSQRWIVPVLVYAAVLASGSNGGEPLGDGLAWSAAMALPAAAWLTRCCLNNEPAAARACLAAAGGARRAQLSALMVAAGGTLVLVGAGTVFEVVVSSAPRGEPGFAPVLAAGTLAAVVAGLMGVAIAALLNPPVVRRPGPAVLATVTVAVWALAAPVSPALAAIRRAAPVRGSHLPVVPAVAALGVSAVGWAVSVLAAAHRADSGP